MRRKKVYYSRLYECMRRLKLLIAKISLSPFLSRQMNSSLVTFKLEMQWHIYIRRKIAASNGAPLKCVIIGTVIHTGCVALCLFFLFYSSFCNFNISTAIYFFLTSLSKTSRLDGNHRPLLMPTHRKIVCYSLRIGTARAHRLHEEFY